MSDLRKAGIAWAITMIFFSLTVLGSNPDALEATLAIMSLVGNILVMAILWSKLDEVIDRTKQ